MDTFSGIFIQLLESSDMSMRDIYRALKEKGVNISYPALAAYKSFNSVPPFDRARMILDVFGYEISDDDLSDILQYSKSELKSIREDDLPFLQQGVRLSPKSFSENINVGELRSFIEDRIQEIELENNTFNSYVTKLIKDDLTNAGYLPVGEDKSL